MMKRRDFVKMTSLSSASLMVASSINVSFKPSDISTLKINPNPLFSLSPWLYMQFMEPLGVTDSSIEASWDHSTDSWRTDLIELTKELAPGMMRWGGLFSAYYKWREAVGPRNKRIPMRNLVWGGIESNQIGTEEFIDFCNQVKADPLMCVNFESEGYSKWAKTDKGEVRFADASEAAEWVDYCNNPSNKERLKHGFKKTFDLKVWQLGNETSYSPNRFNLETAAQKTIEFSKAMRKIDPSIKLIGWGERDWAKPMLERAGENIDYLAFHHMFDPSDKIPGSVLHDNEYRNDPAATWDILMDAYKIHEDKIVDMKERMGSSGMPIALTECHYALKGRNRCEVLSSWAAGVSYARMMNVHERHGDVLKIATLADFCGTRWQVNALMIPVPRGKSFMMPVAKIMSLYRKHTGEEMIEIENVNRDLDITASRTGNIIYLHVVNINRQKPSKLSLNVHGMNIVSGKSFELSGDPTYEIISAENDPLQVKEKELTMNKPIEFPAASVSAIELIIE